MTRKERKSTEEYKQKSREYSRKYRANPLKAPKVAEANRRYLANPENRERIYKRKHSPEGKARRRDYMRKYNYGLKHGEWDLMFKAQGSCCGNDKCRSKEPRGKHWDTDHDHATGKVRGILCHACNLALGSVKDCKERLAGLIEYLDKSQQFCTKAD